MFAEVLQSSGWLRGPSFLRTKQFPCVPNTDFVGNIEFGVVTREQDEDFTSSLAASATRSHKKLKSKNSRLICSVFIKKYFVSPHICLVFYHLTKVTVDGSIRNPVELDEAKRHLQYFLQVESFINERGPF